jgi:hypothetical protein
MAHSNGFSAAHETSERSEHVSVTHASIGKTNVHTVEADRARVERAAVRRFRALHATVDHSTIAFATIEQQATIRQSTAGVIIGNSIACDEVRTVVLASPVVRGEVHTLIDLRTAFALGLGMALGTWMLGVVRGAGRRRHPED